MESSKPLKSAKTLLKCRCCQNPSNNFLELDAPAKAVGGQEKTYKDLLYEIIRLNIPPELEVTMPQNICHRCGTQLKNSFEFIQRAGEISEQYLQLTFYIKEEETSSFEHLQETLIELPDNTMTYEGHERIKEEPLSIECLPKASVNIEEFQLIDVKEEVVEGGQKKENNVKEESQEGSRNLLENSNTDSSDEDDFEPKSEDDMGADFSNEAIARCCDVCQKVYKNEKFLRIHKRYTHMPEEEKLPCPLCAYKAKHSSTLKIHMGLVHGADKVNEYFKPMLDSGKKYLCSQCPRSYGRKDRLRTHILSKHHNQDKEELREKSKPPRQKERFLCTYCGQSYSSKCGLEGHILTHTGDRPYSCDICSKTFKRLNNLQLHRVIHSDEKPHQCSECSKAFKRVDKLKRHMKVHSELRPYKCNECEKTFKYPSVLKTHMHIHTVQTPFSYKIVEKYFH